MWTQKWTSCKNGASKPYHLPTLPVVSLMVPRYSDWRGNFSLYYSKSYASAAWPQGWNTPLVTVNGWFMCVWLSGIPPLFENSLGGRILIDVKAKPPVCSYTKPNIAKPFCVVAQYGRSFWQNPKTRIWMNLELDVNLSQFRTALLLDYGGKKVRGKGHRVTAAFVGSFCGHGVQALGTQLGRSSASVDRQHSLGQSAASSSDSARLMRVMLVPSEGPWRFTHKQHVQRWWDDFVSLRLVRPKYLEDSCSLMLGRCGLLISFRSERVCASVLIFGGFRVSTHRCLPQITRFSRWIYI